MGNARKELLEMADRLEQEAARLRAQAAILGFDDSETIESFLKRAAQKLPDIKPSEWTRIRGVLTGFVQCDLNMHPTMTGLKRAFAAYGSPEFIPWDRAAVEWKRLPNWGSKSYDTFGLILRSMRVEE